MHLYYSTPVVSLLTVGSLTLAEVEAGRRPRPRPVALGAAVLAEVVRVPRIVMAAVALAGRRPRVPADLVSVAVVTAARRPRFGFVSSVASGSVKRFERSSSASVATKSVLSIMRRLASFTMLLIVFFASF